MREKLKLDIDHDHAWTNIDNSGIAGEAQVPLCTSACACVCGCQRGVHSGSIGSWGMLAFLSYL